jgi:hypothetical protein
VNIRTTILTATLSLAAVTGAGVATPAGAQTGGTVPAGDRAVTFCAELDQRRAEADERLAELQLRIDGAQERLADRRIRAEEAGATRTVAVIDARLARLASIEVELPARVAEAFARADAACADLPTP